MRQDALDARFSARFGKTLEIALVELLRLAAPRVAREELKRVGADRRGIAGGGGKTFRNGEVAAYCEGRILITHRRALFPNRNLLAG